MAVTDQQIVARLRELLAESDLQTTTEKMLRKKLEEEFKTELLDKKQLIRQEVERYLAEQEGDESEEEEEEDDESDGGRAPARGSALGCLLSEPLQKFLGEQTLPRTQVVKRLWDYIKANNLQDPKDKRKILLDDKLKTIFTSPLTMFTMNTQLSRHCKTADACDVRDRAPAKRAAPAKATPKAKAKKAKAAEGEGGEEGRKKRVQKSVRLGPALAEWTGKEESNNNELVSYFWTYVKERSLQDPSNKQFILCDEALKKITGEDRIAGFGFAKYIGNHIIKDE